MSIKNAQITLGATGITVNGGAAVTLGVLSTSESSMKAYLAVNGVTPLTRTELTFTGKSPKKNVTSIGGYTQGRSAVFITRPLTKADASITRNSAKVELNFDVETSDAERLAMKLLVCQSIMDSDFDAFHTNQAID